MRRLPKDNTEHNYLMAFVFKKNAGKIPGYFWCGNWNACQKSSKQNAVKAIQTCWWMFGGLGQKQGS